MSNLKYHIKNAVIRKAQLGYQRDGAFLGFYIQLDYGGSGQGFTGWAMDQPIKGGKNYPFGNMNLSRRPQQEFAEAVGLMLKALEVDWFNQLTGMVVRVKRTGDEKDWNGTVFAIGHPLKDKWFDVRDIGLEI
jgi:hypothetical protein